MPARIWAQMVTPALEGLEPEALRGARSAEEFLSDADQDRLNFYRRLAGAFASVEANGGL
jgi:hypothetical protein